VSKLNSIEELFRGRQFDRQVIILSGVVNLTAVRS
jgi:hypothetical protein